MTPTGLPSPLLPNEFDELQHSLRNIPFFRGASGISPQNDCSLKLNTDEENKNYGRYGQSNHNIKGKNNVKGEKSDKPDAEEKINRQKKRYNHSPEKSLNLRQPPQNEVGKTWIWKPKKQLQKPAITERNLL